MKIQTFIQEADWIQASTEKIANNLYEQIQSKGEANVAVSVRIILSNHLK